MTISAQIRSMLSAQIPMRNYDAERRAQLRRQKLRLHQEQGHMVTPRIRMIVTPWFTDPADGLQTRVVRASE